MDELKCEVCGKTAVGVCNGLGPMSSAFCQECLNAGRVTYGNLVGYLFATGSEELIQKESFAEWVHPVIDATLAFYGKTWEEFQQDCKKAWNDYEAYEEGRRLAEDQIDVPDGTDLP